MTDKNTLNNLCFYIFKKNEVTHYPYICEISPTNTTSNIDKAKRFTFDEAVKYHLDNPQFDIIQEIRVYEIINFQIDINKV